MCKKCGKSLVFFAIHWKLDFLHNEQWEFNFHCSIWQREFFPFFKDWLWRLRLTINYNGFNAISFFIWKKNVFVLFFKKGASFRSPWKASKCDMVIKKYKTKKKLKSFSWAPYWYLLHKFLKILTSLTSMLFTEKTLKMNKKKRMRKARSEKKSQDIQRPLFWGYNSCDLVVTVKQKITEQTELV